MYKIKNEGWEVKRDKYGCLVMVDMSRAKISGKNEHIVEYNVPRVEKGLPGITFFTDIVEKVKK